MIKKSDIQKWCDALRSGEYKQTKRCLQDEQGYCCLGVACKVFIPESKLKIENDYIFGNLPESQPTAPEWLKGINQDFANKTGKSLEYLNDINNYDFNEIADMLEATYIKGVLND